ncbi:MAG: hypothetical protein QOE51_2469 [Actinoplanes sp.]|jgi:hypothetical protein|nr:hypothetical protein [Actinoplanes sp.]
MELRDDELPPTDPAESLRLIERERAETELNITPDPRGFTWPWGFAWIIGFGVFFLRFGPDGRVFVDLPGWLPLALLLPLFVAAGAFTGWFGARLRRHISGPSNRQSLMYGITWSVGFSAMAVVLSTTNGLLTDPHATMLWAGAMVALTGAMHMAGGAIWNDRSLFFLGLWTSAVNVGGILAGPGWHALILAVLGGGGLLLAGTLQWLKLRRLATRGR